MTNRLVPRIFPALLAIAVAAALGGCTDNFIGQTPGPVTSDAPGKMRHTHLFGAPGSGKVLERYETLSTYEDFVVTVSSTTLDMQKVLERYDSMEGVTIKRTYRRAMWGFAMHVNSEQVPDVLKRIENDDDIEWVEPDARLNHVAPEGTDLKPGNNQHVPWGIHAIEVDKSSTRAGDEKGRVEGVEVYVLDTGIAPTEELRIVEKLSFLPDGSTEDNIGHGTHVAGTAVAKDNTYGTVGAAPGARLHNFKVLDDNGQTEISTVIAAVEVITERKVNDPDTPVVVNLSFGADVGTDAYNALDDAIAKSIQAGVVYVIAAGNESIDASTVTPAHTLEAITVGAYDKSKQFASFSNYGPVLDLLAPGVDVESTSHTGGEKSAPVMMSGTSTSAPHVTGAAALYLSRNPAATPAEVRDALVKASVDDIIKVPSNTTTRTVNVRRF